MPCNHTVPVNVINLPLKYVRRWEEGSLETGVCMCATFQTTVRQYAIPHSPIQRQNVEMQHFLISNVVIMLHIYSSQQLYTIQ